MILSQIVQNQSALAINQFGIPVEEIPNYIGFIIGTVNIVIELLKLKRENKKLKEEELKTKWNEILIRLEISPDLSNQLIEKNLPELEQTINTIELQKTTIAKNDSK